jgi:AAA domain-containing protein
MINVCFQCGMYRADKNIDPSGPFAICPECGYRQRFAYLPLLVISGASGTGKSTICQQLLGKVKEAVLLDSDILWHPEFNAPENNYREFFETWLRMCKNIAQSGRPVALFGAGVGVPENLENCVERRYFSKIHYLALVCSDDALADRLRARPGWRGSGKPTYIEEHVRFNQWFKSYKPEQQPRIELMDTSRYPIQDCAHQVKDWIESKAGGSS